MQFITFSVTDLGVRVRNLNVIADGNPSCKAAINSNSVSTGCSN
jgi:hypothetical protein